jgi:hypothetical protein
MPPAAGGGRRFDSALTTAFTPRPRYVCVVDVVPKDRPLVNGTGYWRLWLRLAFALGWLLLAGTISFVPKPRRPADEPTMWKLVLWLILFFALLSVIVLVWES